MMTIREKTTLQARVLQSLMETVKIQLTDDSQGGEWLISTDRTKYELAASQDEGGNLVITATLSDDDGEIVREILHGQLLADPRTRRRARAALLYPRGRRRLTGRNQPVGWACT